MRFSSLEDPRQDRLSKNRHGKDPGIEGGDLRRTCVGLRGGKRWFQESLNSIPESAFESA